MNINIYYDEGIEILLFIPANVSIKQTVAIQSSLTYI